LPGLGWIPRKAAPDRLAGRPLRAPAGGDMPEHQKPKPFDPFPSPITSPLDVPLAATVVSSIYPASGLKVPVGTTIVCSLAPLVQDQPQAAPALTNFVTSPGFPQEHRITASAWSVIWGVVPDQERHFELLQQRSRIILRRRRLYLDHEPAIRSGVTILPGGIEKSVKQADLESEVAEILLEILRGWAQDFTIEELAKKAAGAEAEREEGDRLTKGRARRGSGGHRGTRGAFGRAWGVSQGRRVFRKITHAPREGQAKCTATRRPGSCTPATPRT